MRKAADITDSWGSWVRVDVRPGTDLDDPELYVVTVKDEATSAVTLNYEQAVALCDGLLEALGDTF